MVQCATYIRNKLRSENLLERAFAHRPEKGTSDFQLVLVGHSLGAGTAAILALLLRSEYPDVHCYAYSPPGGLLRSVLSLMIINLKRYQILRLAPNVAVYLRPSPPKNSSRPLWWAKTSFRDSVSTSLKHYVQA